MDYSQLVALPSKDSINTGLTSCKPSTLIELLGKPSKKAGTNCSPVTNHALHDRIHTRQFATFRATGLDIALESLDRVLQRIAAKDPELLKGLGTAGMLCNRLMRGSKTQLSNHSWGTAIDLTWHGKLPRRRFGSSVP